MPRGKKTSSSRVATYKQLLCSVLNQKEAQDFCKPIGYNDVNSRRNTKKHIFSEGNRYYLQSVIFQNT